MIIFALALGSASSASACSSSTVAASRRPSILAICVDLTILLSSLYCLGPSSSSSYEAISDICSKFRARGNTDSYSNELENSYCQGQLIHECSSFVQPLLGSGNFPLKCGCRGPGAVENRRAPRPETHLKSHEHIESILTNLCPRCDRLLLDHSLKSVYSKHFLSPSYTSR